MKQSHFTLTCLLPLAFASSLGCALEDSEPLDAMELTLELEQFDEGQIDSLGVDIEDLADAGATYLTGPHPVQDGPGQLLAGDHGSEDHTESGTMTKIFEVNSPAQVIWRNGFGGSFAQQLLQLQGVAINAWNIEVNQFLSGGGNYDYWNDGAYAKSNLCHTNWEAWKNGVLLYGSYYCVARGNVDYVELCTPTCPVNQCGIVPDGCGGTMFCGGNSCQPGQCGNIPDGCGGTIYCGECGPGPFPEPEQ